MHFLPLTEFAYNNSKHAFIGKSSFQIVYDRNSRMNFELAAKEREVMRSIEEREERLRKVKEYVREQLKKTQIYQKKYYDKKHTLKSFVKKDEI